MIDEPMPKAIQQWMDYFHRKITFELHNYGLKKFNEKTESEKNEEDTAQSICILNTIISVHILNNFDNLKKKLNIFQQVLTIQ